MTIYRSQFMTRYGTGIVYATDQGVVKVEIPDLSCSQTAHYTMPPEFKFSGITDHAAQMLSRYFQGERVDFVDIPVVLDGMTPFRQKILSVIRSLTYGEICSYGQVACECNSPHAARAVGGALASNPMPVIIPCHRVVASDGRLTGFSAPGGESTKRALLKMEGVEFKGLRVVTKQLVINRIPVQ
ncbi:MAG: methylated-DNA--[protein]-cysteine S-methyltransferase [Geobacteraceae bacterium]|nr:methylated-DNA--[protein]-cysteine S-methyltransferase [Geobacteraceae bacterium]NTW81064.1 methylated-DNA--[protein]-cysteine S-methyltransferase [Geobacteraceae bacterium]